MTRSNKKTTKNASSAAPKTRRTKRSGAQKINDLRAELEARIAKETAKAERQESPAKNDLVVAAGAIGRVLKNATSDEEDVYKIGTAIDSLLADFEAKTAWFSRPKTQTGERKTELEREQLAAEKLRLKMAALQLKLEASNKKVVQLEDI